MVSLRHQATSRDDLVVDSITDTCPGVLARRRDGDEATVLRPATGCLERPHGRSRAEGLARTRSAAAGAARAASPRERLGIKPARRSSRATVGTHVHASVDVIAVWWSHHLVDVTAGPCLRRHPQQLLLYDVEAPRDIASVALSPVHERQPAFVLDLH